jgi:hypothetical protein
VCSIGYPASEQVCTEPAIASVYNSSVRVPTKKKEAAHLGRPLLAFLPFSPLIFVPVTAACVLAERYLRVSMRLPFVFMNDNPRL